MVTSATAAPATTADDAHGGATRPVVRRVEFGDLADAIREGVEDFMKTPSHLAFLVILYPLVCLIFARMEFGYDVTPLLFLLVAGAAAVGPFVAIGLYEMSRRRETGEELAWRHAFAAARRSSFRTAASVGAIVMALFVAGLALEQWLLGWSPGAGPSAGETLMKAGFAPSTNASLLLAGHALGALCAAAALAIGVVALPLALDRNVSPAFALRTSIRAAIDNPAVMAAWSGVIVAALAIGSLPLFVGLAVAIPVLGHANWRLYRKLVAPGGAARLGEGTRTAEAFAVSADDERGEAAIRRRRPSHGVGLSPTERARPAPGATDGLSELRENDAGARERPRNPFHGGRTPAKAPADVPLDRASRAKRSAAGW